MSRNHKNSVLTDSYKVSNIFFMTLCPHHIILLLNYLSVLRSLVRSCTPHLEPRLSLPASVTPEFPLWKSCLHCTYSISADNMMQFCVEHQVELDHFLLYIFTPQGDRRHVCTKATTSSLKLLWALQQT